MSRWIGVRRFFCVLACVLALAAVGLAGESGGNVWAVGRPVLEPGPQGSFDEVAVKDPTAVFFDGVWHVFYTAVSKTEATTGYVAAKELSGLQAAPRHELAMIRGKSRYGSAPQVFYFEPQRRWYLVFQTRDANYQPAFSTTTTLSKPESWSEPAPLVHKDDRAKWIDFWVICDETKAYLFYTRNHWDVMVRTTRLDAFPGGWGAGQKVFSGVHEAVHIYKVKGRNEYHMIYELNRQGMRSFGLATARELAGPWKKVTDNYAAGSQLQYGERQTRWTDMVSHGEALRAGCDQKLEYEPRGCRLLIQGLLEKDSNGPYVSLPWKLGVMSKGE